MFCRGTLRFISLRKLVLLDAMNLLVNDTIAAIATPIGTGAISVIRISGPDARAVGDRIFRGSVFLSDVPGYSVHHGRIVETGGESIDEVLATVFRSPHSYTGEDSVEFSCHGGMLVTHRVLDAVIGAGARQAEPGEFTKRAFLEGRIDLSQAEAVADLIAAQSGRALRMSMEQLEGRLSGRVRSLRSDLLSLCALLEIDLDFSEEGIDVISGEEIAGKISAADKAIEELADSFELGKIYREGVSVVLAGRPNAGKSSLFNALLKQERAIVTPVPGTTRDSLEESIAVDGILFRMTDTAGLRASEDIVEIEGVNRSKAILQRADIIVEVIDSANEDERDAMLDRYVAFHPDQGMIVAYNKIDIRGARERHPHVQTKNAGFPLEIYLSAKTGEGLQELRKSLVSLATKHGTSQEGSLRVTNRRHWDALMNARKSLASAMGSLTAKVSNEFIAFDVREATSALAEITGEVTTEEILNSIFKTFCIGK